MAELNAIIRRACGPDLDGESLQAAAIVHPPGSLLFKGYSGSLVGASGAERAAGRAVTPGNRSGDASTVPTERGVLALTDRRLLWFATREALQGPRPTRLLVAWSRDEVGLDLDLGSTRHPPRFVLRFPDRSTVVLFTASRAEAVELADAWSGC